MQRSNVGETFITAGYHKRYSSGPFLSINPYIFINQFDNLDGFMESRALKAGFDAQFMNGSMLFSGITQTQEIIKSSFELYGAEIPEGSYKFNNLSLYFRGDRTKIITLNGNASIGEYFHGTRIIGDQ